MTIDKTFDPAAIEARWYKHWVESDAFRPPRPDAEPFTIVMPPPNVTGSLHIGHALDNTLQDVLIRHARLKGKDALWVAGTDHAGIATQMVVERNMALHQQKRTDFTREQFIEKVWEWKAESGGQITRQLRRLGASCDWSREQFTMDPHFSRAVVKVFVDLYNQELLYRDKRLVNWDPGLRTAISDLEVETREINGKFWHFRYPLADGSRHITVATTRPETMLADMAVAVNPEDERYKDIIGAMVRLPITGRLVPIVADEHADPELGSGAVKITPGHDFNDFEVGKRAGFKPADMLNMLDADAKVVQTSDQKIPERFIGLHRFKIDGVDGARELVVSEIEQLGLLEKVEDRVIQTPFGDRSGAVIEPWLTDQWYVDAETLAGPAIEAVRNGDITIVPKSWEKTWFNWLENIQPWCVSRQLWWGHQIPAWFGPKMVDGQTTPDAKIFVATDEDQARTLAQTYYGPNASIYFTEYDSRHSPEGLVSKADWESDNFVLLYRDPDVLDTWFSSALWPFGTLGWPDDTDLVKRHYPNDVLISGFDILFFWDARMAMQGLHFMKEVPWKTLYLHGLVRAADGSKMSKSKGNTVDPLGLIDKYGADALRFTLTAMESQGRDIKLDEKRVEGYRNFATKLWNAARFCQTNGIEGSAAIKPPAAALPVNRWIIAETIKTVQALDLALADFRFDESANTIYHFVWDSFCDWYLELIKPVLAANPPRDRNHSRSVSRSTEEADEMRAVAGWVLDQILIMLHPFMPFVTEELWHALGDRPIDPATGKPRMLIHAHWPMADARAIDPQAQQEIDWLIRLVSEIRSTRTELNVPPGAKIAITPGSDTDGTVIEKLNRNRSSFERLARIGDIHPQGAAVGGAAAQVVVDGATFALPLEGIIDLAAERARLTKSAEAAEKERDGLAGRLANPSFVERAKPEAVEKARADHAEKSAEAERLRAALARLG